MSSSNRIKPVRKVVLPVAGFGTRFLPATKAMPKEMLTVVDRPVIQYAIDEARAAGIDQFIFVTGRNKSAIEDHFDYSFELEHTLASRGKHEVLNQLRDSLPGPGQVAYTRQQEPLGLGHAVWCARDLIGDEPFAVMLVDELLQSPQPCLKQMNDVYRERGGNVIALMDVPGEHVHRYGIADLESDDGNVGKIKGLVEKPKREAAPSNSAVIGRYILHPEVFDHLSRRQIGAGGEIQLTDALDRMLDNHDFYGFHFNGMRFDCGDKAGFLKANITMALQRDDLKDDIQSFIADLAK